MMTMTMSAKAMISRGSVGGFFGLRDRSRCMGDLGFDGTRRRVYRRHKNEHGDDQREKRRNHPVSVRRQAHEAP